MEEDDVRAGPLACDEEPIRIPGSIQRHGFLLVLDAEEKHVIAASENAADFLDVPFVLILGTPLDTVLPLEILGALRGAPSTEANAGLLTYLGSFQIGGGFYSVVTHRVGEELVVEFEALDHLVSPELTSQVITNFVNKLSQITNEDELCRAITRRVRHLTRFNRVLLYRFDDFGHGTVLSEENDGVLPTYLGLRFPGSDIPQQARDLYVLNTVRIIPDADYVPSPLRGDPSRSFRTFDLSMSLLRSVSPVHLQYMRNMGTVASMSISIVCEGRLWGLISCHHAEARTVPYLVRSACDLLTKLVGTQLISFRGRAKLEKMFHFQAVQRQLLTHMAAANDYLGALAEHMPSLMHVADSSGAALIVGGKLVTGGHVPSSESIHKLAACLDAMPDMNIYVTSHLGEQFPWALEFSDTASGLMAIRTSDVKLSYVMWFRPEVQRTVTWAGEPKKVMEDLSFGPRGSFEVWKELVRNTSEEWSEMETDSALDFRAAVMTIGLKRSEEAVQLGEARFSQLTYALPSLVWTTDEAGTLTYVNRLWIDQGLGSDGIWFGHGRVLAEDAGKCEQLWAAAVGTGTLFECEARFNISGQAPERWHMVRAVPFARADGSRAGWVGTCTDLSDKHERDMALRMTEKLALTGRMTNVIAHEINNPLEAIGNLLFLLAAKVEDDTESQNYVKLMENELLRISGITKQTLRWSRESVQTEGYGQTGALFDDVLRLYAGQIRNRNVDVTIEAGPDISIYGQVGQLTQVLSNLVSNAVQAVPIGGKVWLKALDQDGSVSILVRDNGHGMSQDTLRSMFQPFFTTKGDFGNGLGLYISKEIVERHGGTLTASSEVGIGTEMLVRLPSVARTSPFPWH